jgi:hypothetical protein
MKRIIYITVLFAIILFSACDNQTNKYTSEKLDKVFEEAGNNKSELEKVIIYYSEKESDSLKLKAAYFLIENMFEHSYSKAKLVDTTKKIVEFNVLDYIDYD